MYISPSMRHSVTLSNLSISFSEKMCSLLNYSIFFKNFRFGEVNSTFHSFFLALGGYWLVTYGKKKRWDAIILVTLWNSDETWSNIYLTKHMFVILGTELLCRWWQNETPRKFVFFFFPSIRFVWGCLACKNKMARIFFLFWFYEFSRISLFYPVPRIFEIYIGKK